MLRGEPIGGVEAPLLSLPCAGLVMRALERCLAGTPLPGREELVRAVIQEWYADDSIVPENRAGILQGAIDIMVILSEIFLGMKIGHDAQEASKSATVGYKWNERNEFVRDESTKFTIPIGSNHADIELSRRGRAYRRCAVPLCAVRGRGRVRLR